MSDVMKAGYDAGLTFMDKHVDKLIKYAERTKTRSLCHASVPGWRARGFSSAVYLFNRIKQLPEYQLDDIIKAIEQFIISFNNSTGGYYDRWAAMKLEFEERLECLQEIDDEPECVPHNDADNVFADNDGHLIPIQCRCIPVNCKFCVHHGYSQKNILASENTNIWTSAYRCGNITAGRYGLLMSGGLLCRYSVIPDPTK